MLFKTKKWAAPLLIAGAAMGFAACSTDFDAVAPYKDITTVYGLLSMNDSANVHYIRIQKAFLDENTSALTMAQIPDSSFYESLEVKMFEMSNGTPVDSVALQRVNLNKEPGQFFTQPNYVYSFARALNPARRYMLRVRNPKNGSEITGETGVIDTAASVFRVAELQQATFTIDAPKDTDVNAKSIVFSVTPPGSFEPGTTRFYEGVMRIKYVDRVVSTGQQIDRYIDWNFWSGASANGFVRMEANDVAFYAYMASNIGEAPVGIQRYLDSCDVSIRMAGQSYNQYRILTAARGGLTADQIQANFTNLSGPDVLGLFSARAYRIRYNIPVDEGTLERIKVSGITQNLRFVGRSDH